MEALKGSSERELMFLLAGNSTEAFARIYQNYGGNLLRYCQSKIGVREDCEELIQDVFESLWIRRHRLLHVTALESYLFSMVRYKIVDYIRHSQVRRKFEEHYILFEAVYESFESALDNPQEVHELLEKSITRLPDRCQQAFRLRLNENLSYREIAERMNISVKTVEKHIGAALMHLRQAFRDPSYRTG